MIKSVRFATGLVWFGLFLLAGSFLWPLLLPQKVIWTEEQAREKADAGAELHRMTHEAANARIDNIDEEKRQAVMEQLERAQARFDVSKAALERAQRMRDIIPQVLRWCGVAFALIGVVRYKIIQSDDRHRGSKRR